VELRKGVESQSGSQGVGDVVRQYVRRTDLLIVTIYHGPCYTTLLSELPIRSADVYSSMSLSWGSTLGTIQQARLDLVNSGPRTSFTAKSSPHIQPAQTSFLSCPSHRPDQSTLFLYHVFLLEVAATPHIGPVCVSHAKESLFHRISSCAGCIAATTQPSGPLPGETWIVVGLDGWYGREGSEMSSLTWILGITAPG
jgi:hypothetical protein